MDIIPNIELNMADYGGKSGDLVVMGPPSVRSQIRMKNEIGRRMGVTAEGVQTGKAMDAGDVEILMLLSFVRSAPFQFAIEPFLEYCDKLADGGNALFVAMAQAMEKLKDQNSSPSQA